MINAHAGIGVNTRRVFHEAGKRGLGRIIVINKMDADNIDFPALLGTIQELFGKACVPLNVPIGHGGRLQGRGQHAASRRPTPPARWSIRPTIHESLIESIIEVDEAVTERYFEGTLPTAEELPRLIVEAVAAGSLIPILCVSAKTGVGLARAARRAGPVRAAARHDRRASARTRPARKCRSRPIRPARWSPRSSRPASTRSCRS